MTPGPPRGDGAAPAPRDRPPDDGSWALLGLEGHPVSRTPTDPGVVAAARRLLEAPEPPGGPGSGPATGAPSTAQLLPALGALVAPALARHRRLGLPDDVARATLADVGRKVRAYGEDVEAAWFLGLLRADVVAVGRLQAERVAGARGRALHVPEGARLDVRAVRDAVDRADALLGAAAITCTSWLLDPWLRTALAPGSGILRFAALFASTRYPAHPAGASRPAATAPWPGSSSGGRSSSSWRRGGTATGRRFGRPPCSGWRSSACARASTGSSRSGPTRGRRDRRGRCRRARAPGPPRRRRPRRSRPPTCGPRPAARPWASPGGRPGEQPYFIT